MEDLLKVGVITTTHGVRGEVKVYPTTDPERFLSLDRVFLDTGNEIFLNILDDFQIRSLQEIYKFVFIIF